MAGLPVLATIPAYPTPADRRRSVMHGTVLAVIIAGVMLCYAAMYLIRLEVSP
jgi:predicted secreted protein